MDEPAQAPLLAFVCCQCLGIVIPFADANARVGDEPLLIMRDLPGTRGKVAVYPHVGVIGNRSFVHLYEAEHRPQAVIGRGFAG